MKQFNYFIAFLLLTLFSTNVFAQEEQPDTLMLQEVIVSGYFEGLSKALDQKKNNVNITNVVTADQAGHPNTRRWSMYGTSPQCNS